MLKHDFEKDPCTSVADIEDRGLLRFWHKDRFLRSHGGIGRYLPKELLLRMSWTVAFSKFLKGLFNIVGIARV